MVSILLVVMGLILAAGIFPVSAAEARTWTSTYGKTVEGELLSFDGETVELKLADGRKAQFKLSLLSDGDREFLAKWKEEGGGSAADSGGSAAVPVNRDWPEEVEVDISVDDIEIVKEDRESETYVYRSPHFKFTANGRLSTNVVREFSRVFEATYEAVKALPINLNPEPPADGSWDVQLYNTREEYLEDGGPENSGGVYMPATGTVKVPLPNLGVEYTGIRYVVDSDKENATLKHEITHQVMHKMLPYLPVWLIEGFAELVEAVPYGKGRYRFRDIDGAVKESVAGDNREYEMVDLESLMHITHSVWSEGLGTPQGYKNYKSSCLLLYYFLKVDGEGDGAGMFSYLDAVRKVQRRQEMAEVREKAMEEFLLRGRDFDKLKEEVTAGLRSNNTVGLRVSYGARIDAVFAELEEAEAEAGAGGEGK